MLSFILMVIATALGMFLMIEMKKLDQIRVIEIIICNGWSQRFKKQTLEEEKENFLFTYNKYHHVKEKNAQKKVAAWNKEIENYKKAEEKYLSGQKISILDLIPAFGYQAMNDLKLDASNDMLRKLTKKCECSGYIELEKKQETSGKANAQIYAGYLLASLISYLFVGVMLACILLAVALALELETVQVMAFGIAAFAGPALMGYLPYDALRAKADKRQEMVDLDFPNVLSKITLLITAGMSLTRAIEETAARGDSLMYRQLRLVVKEINQGTTVSGAFTRMQCRCENRFLDRLVSVVTKSYTSGNVNLADDRRGINADCWLEKKHSARRMTENIQNKLFVPTMLMFVGILIVIVVPAMAGFNL